MKALYNNQNIFLLLPSVAGQASDFWHTPKVTKNVPKEGRANINRPTMHAPPSESSLFVREIIAAVLSVNLLLSLFAVCEFLV